MAPGPLQIAIVVLLILLVFGAARVPMIAENLAKGIKSFKKGLKDEPEKPEISHSKENDDSKQ